MKLTVLASGSKANAAVLEAGDTRILIDAGLSCTQIAARMNLAGLQVGSLDGVLLTHEHGDHARGVEKLMSQYGVRVYSNPMTGQAMKWGNHAGSGHWTCFLTGETFAMNHLNITAFSVNHDAADPVGFLIQDEYLSLGFVTDLGMVSDATLSYLGDCTTLCIETNYSEELLENDMTRPWRINERISSKNGHLSNQQANLAVQSCGYLKKVIGCHLSSTVNSPQQVVDDIHFDKIEVAHTPENRRHLKPQEIEIL